MEINDPNADPNTQWFVTNGLLTIELISGQMQIGNNAFVNRYSANIPISGDFDDANAPTYAAFQGVSNTRKGDHPQPDKRNQFATNTINKAGQVGDDPSKASADTKIDYYEPGTKHNIPHAFWTFLNASGQALGVLSTVQLAPLAGSNGVGDVGRELAYAQAHSGISGLTLADGTEPFNPNAMGVKLP